MSKVYNNARIFSVIKTFCLGFYSELSHNVLKKVRVKLNGNIS